eukprot:TRINITY_DN4418_c0_g1_i1.p1 TRINITY_DN4418_c0_g1~~TRINITY_DN4418_c0_g1_i1.p1  ORF type:complete len:286 (+),score=67.34 TRINITY_DN4418_c0_g1_i1:504-1361(+)
MCHLGHCLENSNCDEEKAEGRMWTKKAADLGVGKANYNIGMQLIDDGSLEEGVAHLTVAAEAGDSSSMNQLGLMSSSDEESFQYFTQASNLSHPEAMNNLGYAYQHGVGTTQSAPLAMKWYDEAVLLGSIDGLYNKGHLLMTQSKFKESMQCFTAAGENGHIEAQATAGFCSQQGKIESGKSDISAAVYWWTKAADNGHAASQTNLGICHLQGAGCECDPKAAVARFRQSAKQQHPQGMAMLASCLLNGTGCEKDSKSGTAYLVAAANLGSEEAKKALLIAGHGH